MSNPKKRPVRVPIHKQKSLSFDTEPGYRYRLVNETLGRVEAFEKAGWDIVTGDEINTGDQKAGDASQLGSVVRTVVNRNYDAPCKTAVLMRIPEEYYNEDQVDKEVEVRQRYKDLDPNKQGGNSYGSMKIENITE
jgi:hypothetical protein